MGEKYEDVRADQYVKTEGELRVTTKGKTQLEKLEDKVTLLESTLSSIALELDSKVDSNHVIAAINISPEDVRIKGSLIEIDSKTMIEDGAIATATIDPRKIKEALEKHKRMGRI